MGKHLQKTSIRTVWDDLVPFRPYDVPLLFLDSDPATPAFSRPDKQDSSHPNEKEQKRNIPHKTGTIRTAIYLRVITRCDEYDAETARQCKRHEVDNQPTSILAVVAKQGAHPDQRTPAPSWSAQARATRSTRWIGRHRAVFRCDQVRELGQHGLGWCRIADRLHNSPTAAGAHFAAPSAPTGLRSAKPGVHRRVRRRNIHREERRRRL
jgi:hypothetical protein